MKRNLLLVLTALFGMAAVGGLLLAGSGGGDTVRSERGGRGGSGGDLNVSRNAGATTRLVQEVTPDEARRRSSPPGSIVLPGRREPFDGPEEIEARTRYAGRIEELVKMMTDPTLRPDQRMAAAKELQDLLQRMGRRVTPNVRERLLQMLATADPSWKDAIAGAIGSLKDDTDTAKALLEMLRNTPDDIHTRRGILSALGMMKVPEVAPYLMSMIGEGIMDEPLIIRTLGDIAGPEELEQLFERLDKPLIAASRTEIERVLQTRGQTKEFMDKVAAALDDASVQTRRSLLRILSASNDPGHAETVRALLKNETDSESRAIAIAALGRFGDADSGKTLLEIVQGGDEQDKHRAINAIHSIRDPDTVGVLSQNFSGLGPEARTAVMGAISRIPAPAEEMTKIAQEKGLGDPELRVRIAAARTLGQRGRDASVEPLVAYILRSDQRAEWNTALISLENIRTAKAANAAMDLLRIVPNERERANYEARFQKILADTAR